MKFKRTVILTTLVVTMGLLLGISAQAEPTVITEPAQENSALAILNLEVGGELYNVFFVSSIGFAVYGLPPDDSSFPFPGSEDPAGQLGAGAKAAADAVNAALNAEDGIQRVYPGLDAYLIGFNYNQDLQTITSVSSFFSINEGGWQKDTGGLLEWDAVRLVATWAVFTPVDCETECREDRLACLDAADSVVARIECRMEFRTCLAECP